MPRFGNSLQLLTCSPESLAPPQAAWEPVYAVEDVEFRWKELCRIMSCLRPHSKVVVGIPGRLVVKRQILVYGGGRSTRGWDPKPVKCESAREQRQ